MVQFNFDVIKSNGHTVNISWTYSNNLYYDTMHLHSNNYFDVVIGHKTVLATIFHLKVSAWNNLIAPHLPVPNLLMILEVPTSTVFATASWIDNPRRSANGTFPKSPPVPVESPAGFWLIKLEQLLLHGHTIVTIWCGSPSGVWPSIPEYFESWNFQLDSLNSGLMLKTHIENLSIDVKQCLGIGDGWWSIGGGWFGMIIVEQGGAQSVVLDKLRRPPVDS